jgi:hypothetical protein
LTINGNYDYNKDLDFIKCFKEANGNLEMMNELFGKSEGGKGDKKALSQASINQRRQKITKFYGIKLRVQRQSKFIKADKEEARALAMTMGFEVI